MLGSYFDTWKYEQLAVKCCFLLMMMMDVVIVVW